MLGKGDKMPWHISEEFKHFKETTMGHSLLLGRRTYNGIPGKLPGRKMIVMTRNKDSVIGADQIISTEEELKSLFAKFKNSQEILFITGGKCIYEQFYKEADELIISEVETEAEGDVFLDINLDGYNKKEIKRGNKFVVYSYTKGR